MSVIPITVSFSLGLVFIFVALFWREQRRGRFASAERDSLLPLADETPQLAAPVHPPGESPAGDRCGCQRGERPPCAGCRPTAP